MERIAWVMPQTIVQKFAANEYVAACGDTNKVYKFRCDAGMGEGFWGSNRQGSVYLETNKKPGLQKGWNGDQYLSEYKACGTTHEADTEDEFLNGYFVTKSFFGEGTTTPVIVWRGPNNDNTHCTKSLDMDDWETDKS